MTNPGASNLRISAVSVNQFRGISRGVLTFTDSAGRPTSTLLLGDNGSGKSSYLEAVDFGLTGHSPALIDLSRRRRLEPKNMLAKDEEGECTVEVMLSDGRNIISPTDTQKGGLDEFKMVSLLLKRDHLLAFGRGNDDQRGGLLRTIVDTRYLPKDSAGSNEIDMTNRKRQVKEDFNATYARIKSLLKLPRTQELAIDSRQVEIFRTATRITRKQVNKGRAKRFGASITDLISIGETLQALADEHEGLSDKLAKASRSRQRQRVVEVLLTASERLNSAFLAIAHNNVRQVVSRIELTQQDDTGKLAFSVVLPTGMQVPAAAVLSEASLDLAALLALIALIQDGADRGQARVLLLDDVFQSVDDTLRERIADYIFTELSDWQIIIAFHDRIWFERFSDSAKARNFQHAKKRIWRDPSGDTRVSDGYKSSRDYLAELLSDGEFSLVPTVTSRLLEELAESISISLNCSVRRRDGDKYTLSDLLPGIRERLDRYTLIKDKFDRLEGIKYLRNLVGAHSTSWAEGFTDSEAEDFAKAVIDLYNVLVCTTCGSPLRQSSRTIKCRCGRLEPA